MHNQGVSETVDGRWDAVLFDLDGTLTDPIEGITRSIAHALRSLHVFCPPLADLACYVGPPLRVAFRELLEEDASTARIEQAIALYRERFSDIGWQENTRYEGVLPMLETLHRQGVRLFVATSKPHIYARKIVAHFGMDSYFARVYGAELDGTHDDKAELLAHLIQREDLTPGRTAMVGDRKYDVLAARQHGLYTVGVTYGYGTEEELRAAGADALATDPQAVLICLETAGKT